jgi:integrase
MTKGTGAAARAPKALTDFAIKNLKAGDARLELPDGGARGLYLVVQPSGVKSFAVRYRHNGRPQKLTLGRWQSPADLKETVESPDPKIGDALSLAGARKLAADTLHQVGRGRDPAAERRAPSEMLTVAQMLDQFADRYCRKEKKLRSVDQIESAFDRLVKPDIGEYRVHELRRSHVAGMLDDIADESGPVMADRTLAYFRKACNWFATRDEDFNSNSPIVKGMSRSDGNARERILSDQELRDLWAALAIVKDVPSCYPRLVKSLLLCAARRNESTQAHSTEFDGDLWTIPGERYKRLPKHKGCEHVIPLTADMLVLFAYKPQRGRRNGWFVFSSTEGERPFSGFSKAKRQLDKAIAKVREQGDREPMPPWRLHDLRRTARSLLSRAGVSSDHAERCLGHIITGVRGVYDKHGYLAEKREAFARLSDLVHQIVSS